MPRVLVRRATRLTAGLVRVPVGYVSKTPCHNSQEGKNDERRERNGPVRHKQGCVLLGGGNGKQ